MYLYKFLVFIIRPIMHLLFNIKYEGVENIPAQKGAVLICNHRVFLDPVFLGIKIKKQLRFMGKKELFNTPFAPLFKAIGAFPVDRGKGDKSALEKASSIVKNGEIIVIFPEGTRSKTGELLKFKSGAAVVAGQTGADVVPACISYQGKLRIRSKVTVKFGSPIPSNQLFDGVEDLSQLKPSQIKTASTLIRERVAGLLEAPQN